MNSYRDKMVEAMARAIEDANGFSTPVELLAEAALDAALGVLAEPSAEIVEAGVEAFVDALVDRGGFYVHYPEENCTSDEYLIDGQGSISQAMGGALNAMLAVLAEEPNA